jgi:hypothetical protein
MSRVQEIKSGLADPNPKFMTQEKVRERIEVFRLRTRELEADIRDDG